uniref:Uncharacterized protein n=1 Tax=Arundo donax TaxID=35708 RepID=A0A0A9SGH6_ARUDO
MFQLCLNLISSDFSVFSTL